MHRGGICNRLWVDFWGSTGGVLEKVPSIERFFSTFSFILLLWKIGICDYSWRISEFPKSLVPVAYPFDRSFKSRLISPNNLRGDNSILSILLSSASDLSGCSRFSNACQMLCLVRALRYASCSILKISICVGLSSLYSSIPILKLEKSVTMTIPRPPQRACAEVICFCALPAIPLTQAGSETP